MGAYSAPACVRGSGGLVENEMYRLTYLREEVLWWYLGMNQLTDLFLQQRHRLHPMEILDAGCGTGGMLKHLSRYGRVTGFDISQVALRYSRERAQSRLLRASTTDLPFRECAFDLVTSFDVLTMLGPEQHARAFREFLRVLKPGGHLFLRVGAYNRLRGEHDRAGNVRFRFRRHALARALRDAGFEVERTTYANMLLLPVVLVKRLYETLKGHSQESEVQTDFWLPPAPLNRALASALFLENALIRRSVSLPFGLSIVALARRPGSP